jgi:hypothetical protein
VTRIEALKIVLMHARGDIEFLDVSPAEAAQAETIVEQMIAEVEAIPDVVTHATRVLHGAGCVPVVWANAADVLKAEGESVGVQFGEEELREASGRLAKAWDEALSDDLNSMVEETL